MADSVFDDKAKQPDEKALAAALGKKYGLWEKIRAYLEGECDPFAVEWGFPGKKYGWSLRARHKKRTILYLIPMDGRFEIAFVFGDRAVAVIEESTVPEAVKEDLRNARKYVEGRGVRLKVNSGKDVTTVQKLVRIKMQN